MTSTPDPNIISAPSAEQFLGAAVALIPFSIFSVVIRFWARRHQKVDYRIDDWLCLPALAGNLTLAALGIWAHETHSLGYVVPAAPAGTNPLEFRNRQIQIGKILSWTVEVIQSVSITCTKLSCLFFYRRIFLVDRQSAFHWASLSLIIISILWGIGIFLAAMFVCTGHSPSNIWSDIENLNEYCAPWEYLLVVFGISDIILDVPIFILPFAMVFRLHMSTVKKLLTASMFFVGAFAIAAVLMRSYVISAAALASVRLYTKVKSSPNNNLVTAQLLWGNIESTATLTAACLPSVYTPVRSIIHQWQAEMPTWASQTYFNPNRPNKPSRWHLSGISSWHPSKLTRNTATGTDTDDIPMVSQNANGKADKSV